MILLYILAWVAVMIIYSALAEDGEPESGSGGVAVVPACSAGHGGHFGAK
jgi:hypothetical protein